MCEREREGCVCVCGGGGGGMKPYFDCIKSWE